MLDLHNMTPFLTSKTFHIPHLRKSCQSTKTQDLTWSPKATWKFLNEENWSSWEKYPLSALRSEECVAQKWNPEGPSVQFSSVAQLCLTLCNPMNRSTPGLPVHHQLPEFTQTHVHWVSDVIQPSHSLSSSPSPPTFNLPQHQGLFKWVSSLHQVAKGLEFQLKHQSFQWIFRTDFL